MELKLIVSEPWNFTSSDGDNTLYAEADLRDRGISYIGNKFWEWLIVKCTPFVVEGLTISSLLSQVSHAKNVNLPVNTYKSF